MSKRRKDVSEIGYWSQIKLDILKDYASAYSRIISAQKNPRLSHVYIDGFSGAGFHLDKDTKELVWGSPTSVLMIDPPFTEYHLIDLDAGNIDVLQAMVQSRTTGPYNPLSVFFYNADCNEVLLKEVFPRVLYEDFKRALCLLDPYGLHLDWAVVAEAGRMKSVELFLNFPILDMNRNVLLRDPDKADPRQTQRMSRYWGDESWRDAAYSSQGNLFGLDDKMTNESVVQAYRQRLMDVAGFQYVPSPLPMRNTTGAIVYYLFFASHKPVASKIVSEIFKKYSARRS